MKYFAIAVLKDQNGTDYEHNLRLGGYIDKVRAVTAVAKSGGGYVLDQFRRRVCTVEQERRYY